MTCVPRGDSGSTVMLTFTGVIFDPGDVYMHI